MSVNPEDYYPDDLNQLEDDLELTDEDINALKDEVDLLHNGDIKEAAQSVLEQNSLRAILEIAKLGRNASAERVRLDANKYLVDRVLGPTTKIDPAPDEDYDPLIKILKKAGVMDKDV